MSSIKPTTNKFRVKDFLVDFGQIFQIIRIDKIKTDAGPDRLLVFVPYFKTNHESEVISSLPEANLKKTTIRKPLSKKELNKVLSVLFTKPIVYEEAIDVLTAKAILNQNDPNLVVETIKRLYLERLNSDHKFTTSKKYVYGLLVSRLTEEVALVCNTTLSKAKARIDNRTAKLVKYRPDDNQSEKISLS